MAEKRRRTKVVSFEGGDGVGKSTQARILLERLVGAGSRAVGLKLPMAQTPTGRLIYSMLGSGTARQWPIAFQTLQLLDKLGPQLACLPYLRATQDFIVFDRWSTSSVVYGRATGVPDPFLRLGERLLLRPDAVVVLSGQPRVRERADDSYERSARLQARVRDEYAVWAEHNRDIAFVVDASGTQWEVADRVWRALSEKEVV